VDDVIVMLLLVVVVLLMRHTACYLTSWWWAVFEDRAPLLRFHADEYYIQRQGHLKWAIFPDERHLAGDQTSPGGHIGQFAPVGL